MDLSFKFKGFARSGRQQAAVIRDIEQARSMLREGRLDDAFSISEELLRVMPGHYEATCLSAEISARRGERQEALSIFARAIELKPDKPLAYFKRANLLKDLNRLADSLVDYDEAIARDPHFAHAFCNRGVVLQQMERFQDALESYCRASELDPGDALSLFNRGEVLRILNRLDEALEVYAQALLLRPAYAECYCNRGLLQAELNDFEGALASYDRCIEINPRFSTVHFNRGVLFQRQKNWQEALSSYGRVLEINPDHAETYENRGKVFMELRQMEAALNDLEKAVQLQPNFAEAYFSRGNLLARIGSHGKAIENYDAAIAHKPAYADALYNRADTLLQMRQFEAAVDSYDQAFRLDPNRPYLQGMLLYAKLNICRWENLEAATKMFIEGMEADASISPPFPALTLVDLPHLQLKCAQSWVQQQCAIDGMPRAFITQEKRARIRIGYFSGDFHTHPVSMLMAGVIENHDRSKFEIFAFSYGAHVQDAMRQRLKLAFDHFHEIGDMSDQDVATMSRDLGIDVAVDLAGYTGNGRSKIFAWRVAPLQVNFLGYPGTMGANFIDYMIADNTVIPIESRSFYHEKVLSMPTCFMPLNPERNLSSAEFNRERWGLPASGIVFCCFNNAYKITPRTFDIWTAILRRSPGSVLWLSRHNETASQNLRREVLRRGVDVDRLIFADRVTSHAEHLARHRMADLFLDTHPYNAHATAADALCAGLPIIMQAGRGFPARVTTSLLAATGLGQLVTASSEEYEELAVALASNPQRLVYWRNILRENLNKSRLNVRSWTRELEEGYIRICEHNRAGLPPDHIEIRLDA